ncbi:MAG TPA: class II aldolase/adducin family protein [Candidatus Saccharimonadia bacterium]|nr:class II aldolase/adducin family protein [Candidatus Saccharimonadia bacterium]
MDTQTKVAYACNILSMEGHTDTIYGHVSARVENAEQIWMKPATLGLEEVRPHDMLTLDLDGKKLAGVLPRHMEFPIHTEVYRQRPEVQCVIHTHPPYATAFSAVAEPLRPVNHEGALFAPTLPRFTQTSDLIVTPALGQAVAAALGASRALLLKNHGIVVVGTSVEEACVSAILLEKAAHMQLLARQYGAIEWTSDAEALQKQARMYHPEAFQQMWAYFLRKLQR